MIEEETKMNMCERLNIEYINRHNKITYVDELRKISLDDQKNNQIVNKKLCEICDREFILNIWNQKYCSIDCAGKAKKEKRNKREGK